MKGFGAKVDFSSQINKSQLLRLAHSSRGFWADQQRTGHLPRYHPTSNIGLMHLPLFPASHLLGTGPVSAPCGEPFCVNSDSCLLEAAAFSPQLSPTSQEPIWSSSQPGSTEEHLQSVGDRPFRKQPVPFSGYLCLQQWPCSRNSDRILLLSLSQSPSSLAPASRDHLSNKLRAQICVSGSASSSP